MPPPAEGLTSRLIVGPALRTQPDRRLVALVRDGYEAAFDEIVRRYAKPLGRYAASIVGGRSEDVTQDAFSKALVALRRDGVEIELRPWLYRIVRNTALNDLRDRPPTPEALAEAIAGGRSTAEEVENRQEIAELVTRLRALPEPQRAAIVMRELEGLSHEEIAAALGMSGGAARQVIYRARQALRGSAGLLLPVPVLRFLLDHGTELAAGASAGASGAAIATGATAGGAGAGGALKLGAIAAVLAGSVGTGIALEENRNTRDSAGAASSVTRSISETRDSIEPSPSAGDSGDTSSLNRTRPNAESEDRRGHGDGESDLRLEENRPSDGGGRHDGEGPGPIPGPDRSRPGRHRDEAHGERDHPDRPPHPQGGPSKHGPSQEQAGGGQHRGPGGGEQSGPGGRPGHGGGSGGPGPEGGSAPTGPPPPGEEGSGEPNGGGLGGPGGGPGGGPRGGPDGRGPSQGEQPEG